MELFSYDITFESSPADDEEGCKCSIVTKVHPRPHVEIKEEETEASKQKMRDVFKAVEAYLLSEANNMPAGWSAAFLLTCNNKGDRELPVFPPPKLKSVYGG
ncbi:hypothetical protein ACLB2K_034783 [Fragaria x ananassa]